MTPSAARGVLDAIFWKPEAAWRVRAISVLRPVRWFNVRRNEVSDIKPLDSVRGWAEDGTGHYDAAEDRDQRATLGLRDVAYRIDADLVPQTATPGDHAKFRDQFRRRVDRGQCYSQPFLGCREFSASFGPIDLSEAPIEWTEPLGIMFWGFDYTKRPPASHWFEARMANGVLSVPERPLDDPGEVR
jgi:CRISPR-associated protein Cas5d